MTDAALVAVCWGLFDLPHIAVAAILMWGSGDGAAALMGKQFGKHCVSLPFADPKKTWEGSGSMAAVSTAVGFITMVIMTASPWYLNLLSAAVASLFGAYTELVSRNGSDTATVPVVNAVILLIRPVRKPMSAT